MDILDILASPLDWQDPSCWGVLGDLQGNILKGHGRDHTLNHFLRFNGDEAVVKGTIFGFSDLVTSALRQLVDVEAFRNFGRPGGTVVFFFLSASGYQKLGISPPQDPAFLAGMRNRILADPLPSEWEPHLQEECDALLIVGDDSDTRVANAASLITKGFAKGGLEIIGIDAGRALRRQSDKVDAKGDGIEHFGYLDGRSQPLLLAEDVEKERKTDGTDKWNPAFAPIDTALVPDPNGLGPTSFGSYLVYRKLEQNVRGFKEAEKALANALGLTGPDEERAGAMVVGRFEDGTPLLSSKTDGGQPTNNFVYDGEPDGLKCPLQAHIRKTNPRNDSVREFGVSEADERSHLMPRRGIPFGERADDPNDDDLEAKPSGGVGLLFMAYNKDIERQFEFTQISWANNNNFARNATGRDPVIGQSEAAQHAWHKDWGVNSNPKISAPFEDFVSMRGGEYFFAPSLSFLRNLGAEQ